MEIKKMDFSKKKKGIFKKAHKINVHCDAEVSIIMICSNNELYEYTTPTSTMKKIIDQYQSRVGVDLWSNHYEKMQEELRRLNNMNTTLRKEIMQRKGEELDNLNMEQLCSLEEEMLCALKSIRDRKYRLIMVQMDNSRKKVRFLQGIQETLLDMEMEYINRGEVVDEGGRNSGRVYGNPVPVQQPRSLQIDENYENSCITTVSMDAEDSI
ncbi:hypothetical protein C2S51_006474 [Perilla frutescens var. frutescens]|nr:hypothetical protein C2S51_006474 [Perilla frutescens var. frutescens]